MVKNLPAGGRELRGVVLLLSWVDPLEEGKATHSRILAWRIPWTEEPGKPLCTAWQRVGHNQSNLAHAHTWIQDQCIKVIGKQAFS